MIVKETLSENQTQLLGKINLLGKKKKPVREAKVT